MAAKIICIIVLCTILAVLLLFPNVDSQICTKRSVFTKYQTEWYEFTYTETYRGNCWYKCIKSRVRVQRQPREVVKRVIQDKKVCCTGFTRVDDGVDDDRINCQAICMPPCINGACTSPGQCECHEGYVKNLTQCSPVCPNGCQHGACVAPNTCQCQVGHQLVNASICQPLCTEPCANGTCVGPDICQCLIGYRKSERNTCEPYCYSGCEHGSCIAPETCRCDPGWYLTGENECAAVCDPPCNNGTCTAPNLCQCLPGYTSMRSYFNTSEEFCVPSCKNCEGTCVAPNKCVCEPPSQAKHIAADGGYCDCFENCSDANRTCDKTICSITEANAETTELQTIVDDEATENYEQYDQDNSDAKDPLFLDTDVSTDVIESTASVMERNDSVSYNHTSDELKNDESRSKFTWIYIVLCVAVLAVVLLMVILVISKWKYVMIYFKGSSYVVEDTKDDSGSAQFANIQFSAIASNDDYKK